MTSSSQPARMRFPRSNATGSRPGRSGPISERSRPDCGADPVQQPKQTKSALSRTGLPCSPIRQSLGRVICWIGRLIGSRTWWCRRSMSWVARTSPPVCMYCMGWERTTRTSSGSHHWHSAMSVLLSASRRDDYRWPTPLTSIHSPLCCTRQMISRSPMSSRCG
jgi:hypothetical protein